MFGPMKEDRLLSVLAPDWFVGGIKQNAPELEGKWRQLAVGGEHAVVDRDIRPPGTGCGDDLGGRHRSSRSHASTCFAESVNLAFV